MEYRSSCTSSFLSERCNDQFISFFNEHTLFLSVTMNAFEIIAGAALLSVGE
jgi:hypothetical protein